MPGYYIAYDCLLGRLRNHGGGRFVLAWKGSKAGIRDFGTAFAILDVLVGMQTHW